MTDAPDGGQPPAPKRRLFKRAELEARAQAMEGELLAQFAVTKAAVDAANVKIEQRTGRNLPLAIIIGVALAAALLCSLIFVKAFFVLFAAIMVGFTVYELVNALRVSGRHVPHIPTVIAALADIAAAFSLDAEARWLVLLGGILLVALWRTVEVTLPGGRVPSPKYWSDLGAGTLIQVYVAFLASFAVLLTAQPRGQWWILASLLLVILIDVGAYASGLLFGRHPMAPKISPKKTWEGFAGAAVLAIIGALLLSVFMLEEPWWFGLILAAVILFTATIGDLIESLIKRDLGIKDISSWLPGHGGFLDRLDSILPSAAAAYVLYLLFA